MSRQPKITMMGKEIDASELPEPEAAAFEDYFAPVKLTPHAIDRASQIVPEEHWKGRGIYSWLEGRANLAFKHMPISAKETRLGKLRYTFEYTAEGPQLKTVTLVN